MSDAAEAGFQLVWTRASGEAVAFALDGDAFQIGREDADLLIGEPLVSRRHARLERRADGWYVVDLDSTNKTRVNGAPVSEAPLASGDELRFGRAVCRFVARDAAAETAATPGPAGAAPAEG